MRSIHPNLMFKNTSGYALAALAAGCLLAATAPASAAVITAVDINGGGGPTQTGVFTSPVDGSTRNWTDGTIVGTTSAHASSITISGIDTAYAPTGTLVITASSYNSQVDRGASAAISGAFQALYEDYWIINAPKTPASNTTLVISGLQPNTAYGLTIQSFEPNAVRPSGFTPATAGVTNPPGQFVVNDITLNPASSPFGSNAAVQFDSTVAGSSALTTDAAGNLVIQPSATNGARINGFELYTPTAVPEPASFGLLALGGLSLLTRRRR